MCWSAWSYVISNFISCTDSYIYIYIYFLRNKKKETFGYHRQIPKIPPVVSMCVCVRGGGDPDTFLSHYFTEGHTGSLKKQSDLSGPNASPGVSVPVFLRISIVTCDFPGGARTPCLPLWIHQCGYPSYLMLRHKELTWSYKKISHLFSYMSITFGIFISIKIQKEWVISCSKNNNRKCHLFRS